MRHGSLFSGIGGFDLAAEWMGWENIFQCERNDFCQKVLKYHFPDTELLQDITKSDFKKYANRIDILSGGFPCQTFSVAGKGECDLTLWKEMFRAIGEIKPGWVVAENVPGLISQKRGMAFKQVCADLENEGYEISPVIIPAAGKGAPHIRERIWIVAYSDKFRCENEQEKNRKIIYDEKWIVAITEQGGGQQQCGLSESNTNASNAEGIGLQRSIKTNRNKRQECNDKLFDGCNREWERSAVEVAARLCRVDARVPNRMDRIKSLGNAVVPQVVYEFFKAIEKTEYGKEI